jgi:hypothetical protein
LLFQKLLHEINQVLPVLVTLPETVTHREFQVLSWISISGYW